MIGRHTPFIYDCKVSVKALGDWNALGPDLTVREGQFLLIPVARGQQQIEPLHQVVAGDHGICINNVVCDVNRRLRDVGLLAMHADGTLDMAGTLVYAKPSRQGNELFVNLRGRDEAGVVDLQDYVEVQERAIDALLDWRGPRGKRAVCFALKKREAQIVG